MHPCDPVDGDGVIKLDFEERGRLIGGDVPAARSKLPECVLRSADAWIPNPLEAAEPGSSVASRTRPGRFFSAWKPDRMT
ncbi:hypothetical protein ACFWM5_12880 [Streptomyces bobili]|uniref:hypothetical protein n=1 Tax=Streptomyces bobili TaxID=67280 RepID=UPI0036475F0F